MTISRSLTSANALTQSGYVVRATENARGALAALENGKFDLILVDLCMPEVDGLEFLRELSKAKSKAQGDCRVRPITLAESCQATGGQSHSS
jgi:CheY-like chemotaxis protein